MHQLGSCCCLLAGCSCHLDSSRIFGGRASIFWHMFGRKNFKLAYTICILEWSSASALFIYIISLFLFSYEKEISSVDEIIANLRYLPRTLVQHCTVHTGCSEHCIALCCCTWCCTVHWCTPKNYTLAIILLNGWCRGVYTVSPFSVWIITYMSHTVKMKQAECLHFDKIYNKHSMASLKKSSRSNMHQKMLAWPLKILSFLTAQLWAPNSSSGASSTLTKSNTMTSMGISTSL